MTESLQPLLDWIAAHPNWAQLLLLLVALLDAVFLVGAVVPAAPVLFAFGALVALGTLDFWPVVLIAALGALLGDGLSFWLGSRYRHRLFEFRLLRKYPEAVANGQRFFDRHGGKGVMLARFLGPLRAVTPAIAGASGMKLWVFLLADGVASFFWALAYILPGVVFGASLGLAAQVAGRLALLLLVMAIASWLVLALTLFINRHLQRHAEALLGGMLDWSRRHRRLGVFGAALADRDQPETPVLGAVSALLLTLGIAVLLAVWGWSPAPVPPAADMAVFQALQSVQEPWITQLAVYSSMFGEWPVYLPYAAAVFVLLMARKQRRAAAHWAAALLFGGAITLGLGLVPHVSNPLEYRGLIARAFFPRDLVMSVVIYGFTPVLLGGARAYYAISALVLAAILLSRLYLGTLWLSVELIALTCGLLWVGALGLGYRRHQRGEQPTPRQLAAALLVLVVAAGWHWRDEARLRAGTHMPPPKAVAMASADWWLESWETLPGRRQDMTGRDKQILNLQWAGPLEQIESTLRERGWQPPQPLSLPNTLRWLVPDAPVSELPLLPRYHAGRHQALSLRMGRDDQHQYLLRLWPTPYLLDGEQPLWIGTLVEQEARPVARLFRYPINEDIYTAALDSLQLPLPGYETQQVWRTGLSFTTLLLRPASD